MKQYRGIAGNLLNLIKDEGKVLDYQKDLAVKFECTGPAISLSLKRLREDGCITYKDGFIYLTDKTHDYLVNGHAGAPKVQEAKAHPNGNTKANSNSVTPKDYIVEATRVIEQLLNEKNALLAQVARLEEENLGLKRDLRDMTKQQVEAEWVLRDALNNAKKSRPLDFVQ